MNKSQIVISIIIGVVVAGCSNPTDQASNYIDMEKYPQQRGAQWCQEHYLSASASHRDRQASAKHCDSQARQAHIDSKEKEH